MSAVSQAWGRCAKFLYSQVPCLLRPSSFLSDHLRVSRSPFLNRRFLQKALLLSIPVPKRVEKKYENV